MTWHRDILPLLFEGAAAGAGRLRGELRIGETRICGDAVDLDLHDIKWFYDRYRMDRKASKGRWECEVKPGYQTEAAEYRPDTEEYLLFVHGWNMDEWEIERWAETVFKRMWWQGYQGAVGAFLWPTLKWNMPMNLEKLVDAGNFDDSEFRAWQSARTLAELMATLNARGQLRVIAHSQGNVVMGEALRKYLGPEIHTYIATQAAVSAHMWDNTREAKLPGKWAQRWSLHDSPNVFGFYHTGIAPSEPYFIGNYRKVSRLLNFYNPEDYAISGVWEVNMAMRPDQWRSYAYGYKSSEESARNNSYDERRDDFFKSRVKKMANPKTGAGRLIHPIIVTPGKWIPGLKEREKLHLGIEIERYTIFSYIAESYSRALGTQEAIKGPDGKNFERFDLTDIARVPYNEKHYSHSRQFRSNVVDEWAYWLEVGRVCDFKLRKKAN